MKTPTNQQVFDHKAHTGQQVTLKFLGVEDYTLKTSCVADETALNVE